MLADPNDIPQNHRMLIPREQVARETQRERQVTAGVFRAKMAYNSTLAPPSSFAQFGPNIVEQVREGLNKVHEGLVNRTSVLSPAIMSFGTQGGVVPDGVILDAPQMLPMNPTTSILSPLVQRTIERREVARIGNTPGWGEPGMVPIPLGYGTILQRIQQNPLAAAFLLAGLGVVVFAAVKGR